MGEAGRWVDVMAAVLAVVVAVAGLLMGCDDTTWLQEPPAVVRGVWVERTEDVLQGLEQADTVVVSRDAVDFVRYSGYRESFDEHCAPIRRVSETDGSYVIFCGEANEEHIADTRLEFSVSENGREAHITEVVARGTGQDGFFSLGRFGPP